MAAADTLDTCFETLNELVDKMSATALFLFKDLLTSAAQTGNIVLGSGSWAAIKPGEFVVSATADNLPLNSITMEQYNKLYAPTQTGLPALYAQDGLLNVFLWPVPTGQTLKLQTRIGAAQFADLTTQYTVPPGYLNLLGAVTAVRVAPVVIGKIPDDLLREQKSAIDAVWKYDPAIISVPSFTNSDNRGAGRYPSILYGGA